MDLTLQTWWSLALLFVLPIVWWMPTRTLTNFGTRQLRLQAAVRATTLGLLALALAQPVVHWPSGRLAVVYAVDVSESVSPAWIAEARQWVERSRAAAGGWTQVLAFGAAAEPVDEVARLADPRLRSMPCPGRPRCRPPSSKAGSGSSSRPGPED